MKNILTAFALLAIVSSWAVAPNLVLAADSALPPVVDEYRVLSDNWNIEHKDSGPLEESYTFILDRNGQNLLTGGSISSFNSPPSRRTSAQKATSMRWWSITCSKQNKLIHSGR